jgi:hypothetical protein
MQKNSEQSWNPRVGHLNTSRLPLLIRREIKVTGIMISAGSKQFVLRLLAGRKYEAWSHDIEEL